MELASAVSDPWNGSGTTTAAAAGMGHDAFGYDLNPVMVLAARARMLSKREKQSLLPIGATIVRAAEGCTGRHSEPLSTWFSPESASRFRALERAIQQVLVSTTEPFRILDASRIQQISDLAAFFYVALFRTARSFLGHFESSNPTWLKEPNSLKARARPKRPEIEQAFLKQIASMAGAIQEDPLMKDSVVNIALGSSDKLPLRDKTIDFVLSSPPYCTRIDYAVATRIELAVLGYGVDSEFDDLRRMLIGTATVPRVAPEANRTWGDTCNSFLGRVASHGSKASAGYYLKSHLQYFSSIYDSVGEISRTLKTNGGCVLVVQDSYYKEIHNDLPKIIVEMSASHSLELVRHVPFRHQRTMANLNAGVRRYRSTVDAIESVLCFSKN